MIWLIALLALAAADSPASEPSEAAAKQRLHVVVPEVVPRGGNLRIKFRDGSRQGGKSARLCVRPADEPPSCETVEIPTGQFLANRVYPVGAEETWTVRVRTEAERIKQRVTIGPRAQADPSLPTILATGDSLMLPQAQALRDATLGTANVINDVYPSSGLLKPYVVDWTELPGLQLRAHRPDATVLTLGTGDLAPIETPEGMAECCGRRWVVAYSARAHEVMRTYSRDGDAAVVWMNVPYPRDADPALVMKVNRALRQAARGMPRVEILNLASILTPKKKFRRRVKRGDRSIEVRKRDGVHITPEGARLALPAVQRALARLGVRT